MSEGKYKGYCEGCADRLEDHEGLIGSQVEFWETQRIKPTRSARYPPPPDESCSQWLAGGGDKEVLIPFGRHNCALGCGPEGLSFPPLHVDPVPFPLHSPSPVTLHFRYICCISIPIELPLPRWKLVITKSCRMPLPQMFPDWPPEGNYLALTGKFIFTGGTERAKRAATGAVEPDEGHLEGLPPGYMASITIAPAIIRIPRGDSSFWGSALQL